MSVKTLKTPIGTIAYDVKGKGDPLLLCHGMGRASAHWLGFDEYMARDFQVITYDARGLGQSHARTDWNLRIEDLAADAAHVLRHLSLPAAHVFGLSLGGMVAMALGLDYPKKVRSLTITASSIGGLLRPQLSRKALLALTMSFVDKKHLIPRMAKSLWGSNLGAADYMRYMAAWHELEHDKLVRPDAVVKQFLAAHRFRPKERLKQLELPTQVIVGDQDTFVPTANSQFLADLIPTARLEVIEGGGHELTTDSREQIAELIRNFTRGH